MGVKPPGDGGAMKVQGRDHSRRVWMRAGDERAGREREEGRAEGELSRAKDRTPAHQEARTKGILQRRVSVSHQPDKRTRESLLQKPGKGFLLLLFY